MLLIQHIYGIQKNITEGFTYGAAMEKQTQGIDFGYGGKGGEGEM